MSARNYNCDGSGPHSQGQIRRLPTGGDSAALLCYSCYLREIQFRKERNRTLGKAEQFALPEWESLAINVQ